jgi:flagellar motor protein MotB
MVRKIDRYAQDEEINVFQAFTDLMSNAFMIITFLLLISLLRSVSIAEKLESAQPIIIDEKSGKFNFTSGSAELPPKLREHIEKKVIPGIQQAIKKGNTEFIQVIGHTDSPKVKSNSNLDRELIKATKGQKKITTLTAGSNTDLGLMRAVAVLQFLQKNQELKDVKFRAYSAGQLYLPDDRIAPDNNSADGSRRRIEIRFIPTGQKR